jgi:multidrug transporter EmrE-like cation transporter
VDFFSGDSAMVVLAWLALAVAIACSSGGNAFAKWASQQAGLRQQLGMLFAIGTFCLGFVFYALALAGLPLGIAYPVLVGGSVTCVAIIGVFILKERVSARLITGVALILGGLAVLHLGGTAEPLARSDAPNMVFSAARETAGTNAEGL